MTAESDSARGQQAQRLLDDPLLKEAFDASILAAHQAWEDSADNDKELREMLWSRLKGLKLARTYLQTMVRDGKVADDRLKTKPQG